MKKILIKVMLSVIGMLVCLNASAYDFIADGIAYNLNLETRTLSVTSGGNYTGDIVIPDEVTYNTQTLPVVAIESYAFRYNSYDNNTADLKSVTTGKNLLTIGEYAFSHCGIRKLTLTNSVKTIENRAFSDNNFPYLQTVIIEDGIEDIYIGYGWIPAKYTGSPGPSFYGLPLEEVYMGRNVTGGDRGVFTEQKGLKKLTIGKNVTVIDQFSGCTGIETIYSYVEDPSKCTCSFENAVYASAQLIVPYGTLEAYRSATNWKNFFNIVEGIGTLHVNSISLDLTDISLNLGETAQLTATVSPSNAADATLSWISNDEGVATVSVTGLLTAVGSGSCTITCSATDGSGVKATCEVTVASPQSTMTAYAIWCADNQTLYFTYRSETLAAGDTFVPKAGGDVHPITALWNNANVTASGNSMPAWWTTVYSSLKNVVIESSFRKVQPTSMAFWFFFCSGLTSIDLKNLDTSLVTDMAGMFQNCTALTTIYAGKLWNIGNVTSSNNMFTGCTNLVGGNNTALDNDNTGLSYARIDADGTPGYLTGVPDNNETLTDGVAYSKGTDGVCETLEYVRNFSNTNWQALYVPFAIAYENWADDFEVARLNDVHQYDDNEDGVIDRTELEVIKVKSGQTEANTPYLIKAKTVGEKTFTLEDATLYASDERSFNVSSWTTLFTFTGTYSGVSGTDMVSGGYYAMGDGTLRQAESGDSNLSPMRWYMTVTDRNGNPKDVGEVKVVAFEDGLETDGILETNSDRTTTYGTKAEVHDLNGRRVMNPHKGLYIKNGKKMFVR